MEQGEKRILVVDDDAAIRALVMTVLGRRGLAVDGARNGAEALERVRRCHYAVMLLDLMMPILNGWQVLEQIAQRAADARPVIIVLTAGDVLDLPADLVAGTVRKPFDVELLVDSVVACVTAIAAREQLPDCPPIENERNGRPNRN